MCGIGRTARGSRALSRGRRVRGLFQVTVWFHGQPEWAAGEYPTRAAAARAAAELSVVCGPRGERPVGVGVMRMRVPEEAETSAPSGAPDSGQRGAYDLEGETVTP